VLGIVPGLGKAALLSSSMGSDASSNFLVTPDEMKAALERGGPRVVRRIDLHEAYRAFLDNVSERTRRGEPLPNIDPQALKDRADFLARVQNCGRSAREGRLVEHIIIV
jgi:hypothetical protein